MLKNFAKNVIQKCKGLLSRNKKKENFVPKDNPPKASPHVREVHKYRKSYFGYLTDKQRAHRKKRNQMAKESRKKNRSK
jgi:hypothetical protein